MRTQRDEIRDLYAGPGPVASLYLRLDREGGSAAHAEHLLRWRAIRAEMAEQGADEPTLAALDECLATARPTGRVLVVFAAEGKLRHCVELEDCGAPDGGWFGPLPHGLPWLRWQQERLPYVVVHTDRTGAEIVAYAGDGQGVYRDVVVGPDDEIERNAPGGWAGLAQGRYQHRAEDSWAHNAAAVSDRLTRVAHAIGARLVIAAGDVRAVQLLRDHLSAHLRAMLVTVSADGEHRPDGPPTVSPASLRQLVRDATERERAEALARLADLAGPQGRVADGVVPVLAALRESAVDTLFVVDDPADRRMLAVGAQPVEAAIDPLELAADGPPAYAPLADAFARAALGTGAGVVVLQPGEAAPLEGVAALVRHPAVLGAEFL